jgi:hypothetical protein
MRLGKALVFSFREGSDSSGVHSTSSSASAPTTNEIGGTNGRKLRSLHRTGTMDLALRSAGRARSSDELYRYLEATLDLGFVREWVNELYLETDVSERDRFGRLLRYVWLDRGDEVYQVNEAMVRSGYAAQSTFPPDVKYEERIQEAARFAREHGYGLWSACETDAKGDTNELGGVESEQRRARDPR